MTATIPYTNKEMQIIRAIRSIEPNAIFSIKCVIKNKIDYKYGGVIFLNCEPISYEHVLEKIDEEKRRNKYSTTLLAR